ncbi:acyltransferase family protein [Trinickia acidisoli]|uniref:acyltransferase family protein n=1 Tax=Trinickia acidisoli TaxID=2767482 RepID=UPI001A8FE17A|nr:acyltransferase [Trinickia acidisoli]
MTSLRGIAALLIVLNHVTLLMLPLGQTQAKAALIKTGILGMTVFFVLSGFVMYYNYAHRIAANRSEGTVHFLFARFARLYPLLIAYVVLNFVLNVSRSLSSGNAAGASLYVATLPLYLLGVQSWLYAVIDNVNVTVSQYFGNPAWSVSAELFFYTLFVPLIALRKARAPSVTRGLFIVIASIAARAAFLTAANAIPVQHWIAAKLGESSSLSVYAWLVYYCPYGRCFEFFAGMGIAQIWLARRERGHARSVLADRLGLLAGACGLAYVTASFMSEIVFSLPSLFEGIATHFFYIMAVPPAIYFLSRERGVAAKILSRAPLLFLGEISYSLYFVHTLVFPLFRVPPTTDLALHLPMVIGRCAAFLAITLVVSTVVYRTLEKPSRAAIMRMLGMSVRAQTQAQSVQDTEQVASLASRQ